MKDFLDQLTLPPAVEAALRACKNITVPATRADLFAMSMGPDEGVDTFDVVFQVPGNGVVKEADVVRCTNGIAVNYPEDYMRRRDPDCMRIADDRPTDKPRFRDVYGHDFATTKQETLDWLSQQDLIVVPFKAGGLTYGSPSLAIVPANCAFFATALVDLQGFVTLEELGAFTPRLSTLLTSKVSAVLSPSKTSAAYPAAISEAASSGEERCRTVQAHTPPSSARVRRSCSDRARSSESGRTISPLICAALTHPSR